MLLDKNSDFLRVLIGKIERFITFSQFGFSKALYLLAVNLKLNLRTGDIVVKNLDLINVAPLVSRPG